MQPEKNLILYDWLTFSCGFLLDEVLCFLGLESVNWQKGLGSKLHYAERWFYEGISIHWSESFDQKHNSGCCVEMSGQGCRAFETFGGKCFPRLLYDLRIMHAHITRLDVAYDDFTGVIDIDEMFRACNALEFRCVKKSFSTQMTASDRDPAHFGKSVCHGSRSSDVFFRCYDKRVERNAQEDFSHWIRFEIQLRKEAAENFVNASGSLGEKFSAVLNNYLAYLVPDSDDSNISRWDVVHWWSSFVDSVHSISLYSKKDLEYNRNRLENYVFTQCAGAVKAAILVNGYSAFLDMLPSESELNPKYLSVISHERELKKKMEAASELAKQHSLEAVRCAVSQGRRDEILKTIVGGT